MIQLLKQYRRQKKKTIQFRVKIEPMAFAYLQTSSFHWDFFFSSSSFSSLMVFRRFNIKWKRKTYFAPDSVVFKDLLKHIHYVDVDFHSNRVLEVCTVLLLNLFFPGFNEKNYQVFKWVKWSHWFNKKCPSLRIVGYSSAKKVLFIQQTKKTDLQILFCFALGCCSFELRKTLSTVLK